MTPIYILGSGGFAKEVFVLIQHIGEYDVKGFIDTEKKDVIKIGRFNIEVFDEKYLLEQSREVSLAIGIGAPKVIAKIIDKIGNKFNFPNLIHPSVIGNFDDIELGIGNVISANCIFTTSIKIGSFNVFNLNCTVGHDTFIGNYNVVNPSVNISGGVTIADRNLLGVNATILQYINIGNGCTIGASSLVHRDVIDNTTVIGVPAKRLD